MVNPDPKREGQDPGELLRAFCWTQELARRLVRDPGLAADLSQETWTRAFERFGSEAPTRSWLSGTLRSMAFRARRGRERRRLHEARGARPDLAESTEELIERSEAQRCVAECVAELPEELRVALLLHFQESLSTAEVARHLGCSKSTAGERIQRGLEVLRQRLRANDDNWRSCCLLALPFGSGLGALPPAAIAELASAQASAVTGGFGSSILLGLAMNKYAISAALALIVILAVATNSLTGTDQATPTSGPVESVEELAQVDVVDEPVNAKPELSVDAPTQVREAAPEALATAPAEVYEVRARVIDARDRPVPNPRLSADVRDWRKVAHGDEEGVVALKLFQEDLEAIDGNSVTFEITSDPYLTMWAFYVSRDGTSSIAPPALGIVEDLGTVRLKPAGAIEGRVLSSAGGPIALATIQVYDYDPEEPDKRYGYSGVEPTVQTDDDGRFLLPHIQAGTVALGIQHEDFLVDSPTTLVDVHVGVTTTGVVLGGNPAAIVTGRVLDRAGTPLSGAYVNGTGNWSITDTDQTGDDGRFRIGLRKGAPASIEVFLPGWRQVDPLPKTTHGAGELNLVLEPELPPADYRVRIIGEDTGKALYAVGLLVVGEDEAAPEGKLKWVAQPAEGFPVDFTPEEDRLLVGARGYESRILPTNDLASEAPHITVMLSPAAGVRGRLIRAGEPVAGVRVQLADVWLNKAEPRESRRSSGIVRHETVDVRAKDLTGKGGHEMQPVLGLDGEPPAYRLRSAAPASGTRTDEQGFFRFPSLNHPTVALLVELEGQPRRTLGTYSLENGSRDLGEIELRETAALSGQFHCSHPWEPSDYSIVLREPRREVSLDADGRFHLDDIEPGPTYFGLSLAGVEDIFVGLGIGFEDLPDFHVDLAAGQKRDFSIDLDPYVRATLDLSITIQGQPLDATARLLASPVEDPERVFGIGGNVDGSQITTSSRSLGPCRLVLRQRGLSAGWVKLDLPGPDFDLRANHTLRRTIDIPAGSVQVRFSSGHVAAAVEQWNVELESLDRRAQVIGVRHGPGNTETDRQVHLGPIAPGTYRVVLRPAPWVAEPSDPKVLGTFEVEVRAGETATIQL